MWGYGGVCGVQASTPSGSVGWVDTGNRQDGAPRMEVPLEGPSSVPMYKMNPRRRPKGGNCADSQHPKCIPGVLCPTSLGGETLHEISVRSWRSCSLLLDLIPSFPVLLCIKPTEMAPKEPSKGWLGCMELAGWMGTACGSLFAVVLELVCVCAAWSQRDR